MVVAPRISSCTGIARHFEPIKITSEMMLPTSDFHIPNHYKSDVRTILIPHGLIIDRIASLARSIRADNPTETLHLVCVLKGGFHFFNDLQKALKSCHESTSNNVPFTFDFVRAKSYAGTSTTGEVKISGLDTSKLLGRHVVLCEDIVDTGRTMALLAPLLEESKPKSLRVASLLEKRREDSDIKFVADYVGFSVPDEFVVGFCLDYNDAFRDLDHICCISPAGIERFKDGVI